MRIILALFFILVAASPLAAAQRNYSVTDFTRIKLEGPFAVTLATNVAPFARAALQRGFSARWSSKFADRFFGVR